ncbi:MAG TPA: ribokinase [Solirubrobacteraceae bacterium]
MTAANDPAEPSPASSTRTGLVVIVGSLNVDLVVRVQRLPTAGETVAGETLERHGGGKGANQAVAAARAGAEVRFLGAVGEDDFAEQALEELRQAKIDVSGVVRIPGVSTGVACIVVDDGGENQIAVASGANAKLDQTAVQRWLRNGELPEDAVCLLNFEIPDPPLVAAARCAAAAALRWIVVNPAPARAPAAAVLEARPILTPNAGELEALIGGGDRPPRESARAPSAEQSAGAPSAEQSARELSGVTGAPVVVTLGAQGAVLVSGEQSWAVAAPRTQAVDTTGAGDAFNGAFAAALAQGYELPAAVQRAVVAGSCSVADRGARGGMPTRDQIDRATTGHSAPRRDP